tara:strand:- start:246 stop:815 length:570 start_codon:yes stop_codon:yes gene_type:complete
MFLKNSFYFLFLIIFSCQPVELMPTIELDNSRLDKISINAKDLLINIKYNPIFSDENIEDQITNSPLKIIQSWISENVNYFGNQNKLIINVIDASILRKEIENIDAKKYQEKTIYNYEISYLVEYELLTDNDYLLANTTVETSRSTTSKKYISLNEKEVIINDLLNKALIDFTNETKIMINQYMKEYIK